MDYNIIDKYIKFLKTEYLNFFRIIFANNYQKKLCIPFLDRYIDVRYYNETSYPRESDFVNRVNKELLNVYKKNLTDENEDMLKNIVALFGYIIYFDDIDAFVYEADLINNLIDDENITISSKKDVKSELLNWYKEFKKNKEKFNNAIISKEFSLVEKRIYRSAYKLDLDYNIKISNLYSEYAINKAYNMPTIKEQRLFITYIMGSYLVLEHAKNLDFSKHYIVDFSESLFAKDKKCKRLFNIFDNVLTKKMISILISYEEYMNNKAVIDAYINEGYSFALLLDEKFNGNTDCFVLFSYIFVHEEHELYEMVIAEKNKIKSKIITL